MDQDLARLVKEGKLPYDLAASYAFDLKDFNRVLHT
jgi:twitching motility protein PilT